MSRFRVDKSQDPDTHGEERKVFQDYLRTKGLKFTQTRQVLLERIFEMHDHFTADQLLDRLRDAQVRISKATVYRTLKVMLDSGLLECHDFGEGARYYEHSFGHQNHDHLFCVHCNQIEEFHHPQIKELHQRVASDLGFRLLSHSLKIFGLCRQCTRQPELAERYRDYRMIPSAISSGLGDSAE